MQGQLLQYEVQQLLVVVWTKVLLEQSIGHYLGPCYLLSLCIRRLDFGFL